MNTISTFDSDCIRKKSNWSKSNPDFKLDSKSFDPELFFKNIKSHSPKLHTLLQKIQKLDKEDMKKDGHHYKHFIFCDVKSSNQGARMLASAFMSSGYELGYYANAKGNPKRELSAESRETPKSSKKEKKVREDTPRPPSALPKEKIVRKNKSLEKISEGDEESSSKKTGGENAKSRFDKIELLSSYQLNKTKNNNFYLLSSVNVFDQPINVSTKKQMLANYNKRPENVHGREIRWTAGLKKELICLMSNMCIYLNHL